MVLFCFRHKKKRPKNEKINFIKKIKMQKNSSFYSFWSFGTMLFFFLASFRFRRNGSNIFLTIWESIWSHFHVLKLYFYIKCLKTNYFDVFSCFLMLLSDPAYAFHPYKHGLLVLRDCIRLRDIVSLRRRFLLKVKFLTSILADNYLLVGNH